MKRGDWGPVYMLIVIIIAVILLITFIKPLFSQTAATTQQQLTNARTATGMLFPFP